MAPQILRLTFETGRKERKLAKPPAYLSPYTRTSKSLLGKHPSPSYSTLLSSVSLAQNWVLCSLSCKGGWEDGARAAVSGSDQPAAAFGPHALPF